MRAFLNKGITISPPLKIKLLLNKFNKNSSDDKISYAEVNQYYI